MIGDHLRPAVELTPQQQIAAGERVQDLVNHPGWGDLLAAAREYDRQLDGSITFGHNSLIEYVRKTGIRTGLEQVFELAVEVIETGKAQRAEGEDQFDG